MLSMPESSTPWNEVLARCVGKLPEDWFILRVRGGYEDIAKSFIQAQLTGSEIYYPVAQGWRLVGRPRAKREVKRQGQPAFKGYVFARFPKQQPEWDRLSTYCAAQPSLLVMLDAEGEPVPMYATQAAIQDVMRREVKGGYNDPTENPLNILIGTTWTVVSGPFMGHPAKVKSIEEEIVRVTVKVLGKRHVLSFTFEDVFPDLNGLLNL